MIFTLSPYVHDFFSRSCPNQDQPPLSSQWQQFTQHVALPQNAVVTWIKLHGAAVKIAENMLQLVFSMMFIGTSVLGRWCNLTHFSTGWCNHQFAVYVEILELILRVEGSVEKREAKWPGADLLFRLDQLLFPRLNGPGDGVSRKPVRRCWCEILGRVKRKIQNVL